MGKWLVAVGVAVVAVGVGLVALWLLGDRLNPEQQLVADYVHENLGSGAEFIRWDGPRISDDSDRRNLMRAKFRVNGRTMDMVFDLQKDGAVDSLPYDGYAWWCGYYMRWDKLAYAEAAVRGGDWDVPQRR